MARILFGVHGTGRGHAMRAITVANHYPAHEFLFVSHGEAARLLRSHYRVLECPNPVTPIRAHRVQTLSAITLSGRTLAARSHWTREVRKAAEEFKPDVAFTDYEYFVPRVARAMGLPSVSLGNEHLIVRGRIDVPIGQFASWLGLSLAVRFLFSAAEQYVVSCFFDVPLRKSSVWYRWTPPILRKEVLALRAEAGEHVVAYQGYSTFPGFIDNLAMLDRPVRVYGMGRRPDHGRLSFKDFREQAFLEDLATCAYVVCGGGHTLISEALHLGKPVFSIPVHGMFEQFLNATYVERCGYGRRASTASFSIAGLKKFEKRLDSYRHRIHERSFCGNEAVFAALDDFISGRWRRRTPHPAAPTI